MAWKPEIQQNQLRSTVTGMTQTQRPLSFPCLFLLFIEAFVLFEEAFEQQMQIYCSLTVGRVKKYLHTV